MAVSELEQVQNLYAGEVV